MYLFNELQEFYGIIYIKKNINISLIPDLVEFWKNNKDFWFSHKEIKMLNTINSVYDDCKEYNISLLLHYDQIFRHPCKHIVDAERGIAYKFATHIALRILHSTQYSIMEDWEKIFVLLTLRHNKSLQMKNLCLKKAYIELSNKDGVEENIWLRFINATILDINKFKNNAGHVKINNKQNELYKNNIDKNNIDKNNNINISLQRIKKISETIREKYNDILEKQNAELLVSSNIVNKHYNELYDEVNALVCNSVPHNKLAVSISGGVDSMVLSYISSIVCKKNNIELILLHICYNNRDCCTMELEFLKDWADFLETPLFVREIDEIQRSRSTKYRTMYEDVTRRIRFSFYKYFSCPVVLGHNRDDTFENMFSNLSKGIHFDNLAGMSNNSIEDGINILRPFLTINKKTLLEFADSMNIPHLYDSTPPWSRRGKTRDNLVPAINKFDPLILDGLEKFTQYTTFLHKQWESQFEIWNTKHVLKHDISDTLKIIRDSYFTDNYKNISFWIRIWFDNNMPTRPSNKSFTNLITNITKNHCIKCNMNKEFICIINESKIIFERKK